MTLLYCNLDISFSPEKYLDKITFFHTEISTTNFLQDMYLATQIHFSYNILKQTPGHANIIQITRITVWQL
jgi:hypothetical protein